MVPQAGVEPATCRCSVPANVLSLCRRDYETRTEKLKTDKGVWNDVSMYYVYAHKYGGT